MNSEIKYKFGGKLRTIRERKKITLKQVARLAKVSESLVSQIERNKVSPSIDTLLAIADVLGIDYDYLFSDYKKNKDVSIVRMDHRDSMLADGITLYQLSVMADIPEEHDLEAFLMEIPVGAEKGSMEYGHVGKEFGMILTGDARLVYGTETYDLAAGDSVGFPSDIPHTLQNTGTTVLKAIWVVTPPRMLFGGRR